MKYAFVSAILFIMVGGITYGDRRRSEFNSELSS